MNSDTSQRRRRRPGPVSAFLGSVGISSVGDGFRYAALPLLLALYGSSPTVLGLLLAVGTSPFLLVGPFSGALVDRYDRVLVLRIADLGRFAVGSAFAAMLVFGAARPVVVAMAFVVAFVMGVGEAFAYPAAFAITPTLGEFAELTRLNGRISALETLGRNMIGPLFGSALVARFASGPFLADALTFAASWMLLVRLGRRPVAQALDGQPRVLRAEVRDGIRWLRAQPVLGALTAASAIVNVANMGFLATQAL